jgi:hypothetical protein
MPTVTDIVSGLVGGSLSEADACELMGVPAAARPQLSGILGRLLALGASGGDRYSKQMWRQIVGGDGLSAAVEDWAKANAKSMNGGLALQSKQYSVTFFDLNKEEREQTISQNWSQIGFVYGYSSVVLGVTYSEQTPPIYPYNRCDYVDGYVAPQQDQVNQANVGTTGRSIDPFTPLSMWTGPHAGLIAPCAVQVYSAKQVMEYHVRLPVDGEANEVKRVVITTHYAALPWQTGL